MAKPKSSLDDRFEQMEARLNASEARVRHLEAHRANLNREIKRLREEPNLPPPPLIEMGKPK